MVARSSRSETSSGCPLRNDSFAAIPTATARTPSGYPAGRPSESSPGLRKTSRSKMPSPPPCAPSLQGSILLEHDPSAPGQSTAHLAGALRRHRLHEWRRDRARRSHERSLRLSRAPHQGTHPRQHHRRRHDLARRHRRRNHGPATHRSTSPRRTSTPPTTTPQPTTHPDLRTSSQGQHSRAVDSVTGVLTRHAPCEVEPTEGSRYRLRRNVDCTGSSRYQFGGASHRRAGRSIRHQDGRCSTCVPRNARPALTGE